MKVRAAIADDAPIYKLPLDLPLEELKGHFPGITPSVEESEWVGCTDYTFVTEDYTLTAQVENDKVVGYIHNTERYRQKPHLMIRKLIDLLEYYGERSEFEFTVDNGFGNLYRSKDKSLRASYSYICDIFSTSYFRLERRSSPENQGEPSSALDLLLALELTRQTQKSIALIPENHSLLPPRIADLSYLEAHDSPTEYEFPAGFDYKQFIEEIRALGPHLSVILGQPLRLDDQVQDASYFAEWFVHETEKRAFSGIASGVAHHKVSIRFSAFGRMYAIYPDSELNPLPDEVKGRLIDFLASRKFVYVPSHLLELPCPSPIARDWQIRFFDYL